jgi:amino acid transporter
MNVKKISLISATIICINAMIGVGIFTTPAKLALSVGPAGILTYLFAIVAVTFIALSLALLSREYPEEGSFYNYTKQWAGSIIGFIAALSYVIGIVIALGLLAKIASQYFNQFLPYLNKETWGLIIVFVISAWLFWKIAKSNKNMVLS